MSRLFSKTFIVLAVLALVLSRAMGADEPPSPPTGELDIRELANQVDVLQLVADLKLKEKQVAYVAAKVDTLRQRQEELRKHEEAILQGIKEPLEQMRDALAAGREVPSSAEGLASAKLKELREIRQRAWQEFQSAVSECIAQLDEGQVRIITRSPKARSQAAQMVQQIRSASERDWPKTLEELASRLLEIKTFDKQAQWQADLDNYKGLPENAQEKALEDFEGRKEAEIAQMRAEVGQMLTSIRTADERILSIGVNKLASALRSNTEVRAQLHMMIGQILDSPAAEAAFKARLANIKATSEESPPDL